MWGGIGVSIPIERWEGINFPNKTLKKLRGKIVSFYYLFGCEVDELGSIELDVSFL